MVPIFDCILLWLTVIEIVMLESPVYYTYFLAARLELIAVVAEKYKRSPEN